ncbi:S8 family serine peptidase [Aliidiomarina halalkaliphila]|uniref:S8 family serine peptidase n=1 Tax=Aliidiomarina halalkaliphila TaxID=2593535 RepID=A0A552X4A5_9GAMM|nr:S8 family serine peptidase [Aliidiomarina halalkaliphila]TRW49858.1 S8 family serine peptidase [Aliidiomarina halalkaliphila]
MKKSSVSAAIGAALALSMAHASHASVLGDVLKNTIDTLDPTDKVMVVVTYDQLEPVSESQLGRLLDIGITEGVQFQSLPVIGVLADPSQIEAISLKPEVRSVWLNRPLEYFNAGSRQITGVEQVQGQDFIDRNGLEFTGKGVTVVVHDSGIDASHQDHFFGDTVVENVQGLTHAQALRLLGTNGFWLEGQINTDTNSGHGTHVAGTIAGNGMMSDGKYAGVAPDAELVGYGSGGGIAILDALGGFDYAISNVYSFNSPIRIISNSWGSSGKFDPNGPITIATYKAYQLGILSVFAAGNSGPGEDTHNPYAQIPWGVSVGAGTKDGDLASFSSRGLAGESGSFTMPDGSEWTYTNDVTIVAPGVDVISTRASTNLSANGGANDIGAIEEEYLPFYTMISGTSMATPHVSGVLALMMEANPRLQPLDYVELLKQTATNMPGRESWEVGAGYVNARAALSAVLGYNQEFSENVNSLRDFNANALTSISERTENFEVLYSPVGDPDTFTFDVDDSTAWVKASASSLANTVKLMLVAPDGTEYSGNLTLPALETAMRVSAPGQAGTWTLYAYGLTSLSGVEADPLGLTNGPGVPELISGQVEFVESAGYDGVDDIEGHPLQGAIEYAISRRLVDGLNNGRFRPNANLQRQQLAEYLVMGAAVRQYRDLLNEPSPSVSQLPRGKESFALAVSQAGGALRDTDYSQQSVMRIVNDQFAPRDAVTKLDLAYSFVQSLGLQAAAEAFDPDQPITVTYQGQTIAISDQNAIPRELRGHVQMALNLSLSNVKFDIKQGLLDLQPTITATFEPEKTITRAEYSVWASRLYDGYFQ